MQLDLRTILLVQFSLYACLGLVCLFLPYRRPGSGAVTYWGYGLLLLAVGTAGIGLRGLIPDVLSYTVANALLLVAFLFLRDSTQGGGSLRSDRFGWGAVATAVLLLVYFTYLQPDLRVRIVIFSVTAAILIARPASGLIAAASKDARRARMFTAACFLAGSFVMLVRAVLSLKWDSGADLLSPNAVQSVSYLLFSVVAVILTLGVVWIEIEHLQANLTRMAMLDSLTGTLNRGAFMREYERELSRCKREKSGLALVIFDVDYFKRVNDSHGHAVGDQVLRLAVHAMRASLRGHDILGRYGGEEFVLLLPGADQDAAILAAERVRHAVSQKPLEVEQHSISITLSGGVAAYGVDGSDWESLLRSADAALYRAKLGGRNRVLAATGTATPQAGA